MTEPQQSSPTIRWLLFRNCRPAKTGRTKNLVLMLRDALPAEEASAGGTACSRLPPPMIVTTLVSDIWHGLINIAPELFSTPLA